MVLKMLFKYEHIEELPYPLLRGCLFVIVSPLFPSLRGLPHRRHCDSERSEEEAISSFSFNKERDCHAVLRTAGNDRMGATRNGIATPPSEARNDRKKSVRLAMKNKNNREVSNDRKNKRADLQ